MAKHTTSNWDRVATGAKHVMHAAVGVKKSAFSTISTGAGYHHSHVGHLQKARKGHSSKVRTRSGSKGR